MENFNLKIIRNPANSEMDKYTPEYSLKNIPFPSYHVFQLALTEKIVDFVKRLRWKAFFYLDSCKNTDDVKKDVYNLKSPNTPPNNRLLDSFETDLFKLIKMVKFKKVRNNFQMKLSQDINEVKTSNYIWVKSDKSKNIYKIKPSNYQEILKSKIINNYKIDYINTIEQINKDTSNFASRLQIEDRLGKFKKKDAYILIKDHKPNFENKLPTRLINPSKSELGRISKFIIQNIVNSVKKANHCNLWENSYETIEWFRRIKNKSKATFIQFDIIDFYPSITKNILIDSINYARKYIDITVEQYEIILACRKTVLKNNDSTWVKNGLDNFDVPMGGYDSSQIADLVGLYILDILTRIISPQQVGLYRDDGLLYIPNSNGPLSSSIQKRIIRAFKFLGFKIEISSNIKIANFLDVTLDLSNNSYKPFIKPNQNPSYINVNSNHPKNIIKQIPKAVNLRIGKLSANEKIFKESSKRYIEALKNSGFKEDFRYLKQNITTEFTKENNNYVQKNRKRKIIWFNPPFCKLANIDVGKYFLRLIDKHFKQDNILHKIFNRKTLKISYSCTNNISQIINSHNNKLINKFHNQINNNNINSKKIECNCKSQSDCPMNGLCSLDNVVYQAIIYPKEDISDKKYYIGISSTNFKIRYGNHKYSFSHEHQKNQTALSKHYWGLKNKGLTPDIQWSILKRSSTPKSFDSRCNLCLEEKIHILLFPEPKILLNKRNELIARCRHRAKFKL